MENIESYNKKIKEISQRIDEIVKELNEIEITKIHITNEFIHLTTISMLIYFICCLTTAPAFSGLLVPYLLAKAPRYHQLYKSYKKRDELSLEIERATLKRELAKVEKDLYYLRYAGVLRTYNIQVPSNSNKLDKALVRKLSREKK